MLIFQCVWKTLNCNDCGDNDDDGGGSYDDNALQLNWKWTYVNNQYLKWDQWEGLDLPVQVLHILFGMTPFL